MNEWTYRQRCAQRRKLDPERHTGGYILGVESGGAINVRTGRERWDSYYKGDPIIDTFMGSNQFDKALFITLVFVFGVKTRVALEICLS
jgi:hypothetical protein